MQQSNITEMDIKEKEKSINKLAELNEELKCATERIAYLTGLLHKPTDNITKTELDTLKEELQNSEDREGWLKEKIHQEGVKIRTIEKNPEFEAFIKDLPQWYYITKIHLDITGNDAIDGIRTATLTLKPRKYTL